MAANDVYINPGATITFTDTTGDAAITLNNLGDLEGRVSIRVDRGAGPWPDEYEWRAVFQYDVAHLLADTVDLYIATSDGTNVDGDVGAVDAALGGVDQLKNLHYIGSVSSDSVNADESYVASGIARITSRYFSLVVWNAAVTATDNLQATNDVNKVIFTPIPAQVQ